MWVMSPQHLFIVHKGAFCFNKTKNLHPQETHVVTSDIKLVVSNLFCLKANSEKNTNVYDQHFNIEYERNFIGSYGIGGRGVLLQWRWYTLLIRQMSVGTHITSQPLKCSYEQQFIDNWYNKKHIFGLRPDSWHRASKTFGTSWVVKVIGASFVNHSKPLSTLAEFMLMRWLLMSP